MKRTQGLATVYLVIAICIALQACGGTDFASGEKERRIGHWFY